MDSLMTDLVDGFHLKNAWDVITATLRPFDKSRKKLGNFSSSFEYSILLFHQKEMIHLIWEWFFEAFKEDLYEDLVPEFWDIFKNCPRSAFWKFPSAINNLYNRLQVYYPAVKELQALQFSLRARLNEMPHHVKISLDNYREPLISQFLEILQSILFAKCPVDFYSVLFDFYSQGYKAYQGKFAEIKDDEQEPTIDCPYCEQEKEKCCCEEHIRVFKSVIIMLYELRFYKRLIGDIPIYVAHSFIKKYIQDYCKGNYEVSYLNMLRKWLDESIMGWLKIIHPPETLEDTPNIFVEYKEKLTNILYEAFAEACMEQLFDIIIEFPDSQAALEDLKECMEVTNLRSKLITTLKNSLETRLLHPGVNTSDILTAYISAIKALRVLDHTGVVLQVVSEPVCKYLRSRDDTVRCIISSLREDSCGELAVELMKGVPLKLEDAYQSDEEMEDWEKWNPDPVDADPAKTTETQRSSDIISLLVNIYGSKELFVNEYRNLLADRILTTFSYNTEKEIRYLELLKLRFGESQLHFCEVMLKDIADSKRLNTHINSGDVKNYEQGDFPINTMILSAQFWPAFKEENIKLPEFIWTNLKKYTKAFEALKGNRTLVWKPHLGSVDLEITLKSRTVNISVSPVHASILWQFQEKPCWTIGELSNELLLQPSVLRRKITLWQNQGILREENPDTFILIEDEKETNRDSVVMIEEEEESVTASSQDVKEEELQTFWTFIVGMLTNMESLPLERIHSMLRMFAVQGTSTNECSIHDMKQFLEKKVRDRQLVYSAGMFRLPKFDS